MILRWLSESSLSGYALMQRCKKIFGRASPGSVYPILHQMEEQGVISKEGGKYALTEAGKALLSRLESEKRKRMEDARKVLRALSEIFDDPGLRHLAETMPDWLTFSPRLLSALADLREEILRLGDDAIPYILDAVHRMRASRASSKRRSSRRGSP